MDHDVIGEIVREPDPQGIDNRRWIDLIREHPSLVPPEPVERASPFTKKEMTIKPLPDVARVVVDGREVGVMSWAMDESNRINVFGEPLAVAPLAHEIARSPGGRFRASPDQERR